MLLQPPQAVFLVSVLVVLLSILYHYFLRSATPSSLLQLLAIDQFTWTLSTTPIPISAVSVLAKSLLSKDLSSLPVAFHHLLPDDDTVHLQPVRDILNLQRLDAVKRFCQKNSCQFGEADTLYGLTPLHLAKFTGDTKLAEWLKENGAEEVNDHVNRKPRNLSFTHFISNAKKWKREGETCDFPIVDFTDDSKFEWAKGEVRRLVGEGEPVLMRGAFNKYYGEHWDVDEWVKRFADVQVTVGYVPYANAFKLSTRRMSLKEYHDVTKTESVPSYVFNKHVGISKGAYDALRALYTDCLPLNIISDPNETGGLDNIHFFYGRKNSGAPFHVHADALNAAVSGSKRWFAYTPQRTIYSRKTIQRWVKEDYERLSEEERPLECMQTAGDVVYVPLDWGHAVINGHDDTFGFAMEVLNRRDTLSHLWR